MFPSGVGPPSSIMSLTLLEQNSKMVGAGRTMCVVKYEVTHKLSCFLFLIFYR